MIEVQVELRGGPASYTNLAVYRDNRHQLPPTVEVLVTGGVLDYKLTSSVTEPDGHPIYRCPTNWRSAVHPPEPPPKPSPAVAPQPTPAPPVDRLDALLAALDAKDARAAADDRNPFALPPN